MWNQINYNLQNNYRYYFEFKGLQIIDNLKALYKNEEHELKDILVWSILYQTLMVDISNIRKIDETNYENEIISEESKLKRLLNGEAYPCHYLFMYRNYFLDEVTYN